MTKTRATYYDKLKQDNPERYWSADVQRHSQRKGKDQETDNPISPLATSKAGCIINPTDEPEPPKLNPL